MNLFTEGKHLTDKIIAFSFHFKLTIFFVLSQERQTKVLIDVNEWMNEWLNLESMVLNLKKKANREHYLHIKYTLST